MDKGLEKLLFNPIRLKIISFLISVEKANFKKLMEITDSSKGNVSTQIKKLENEGRHSNNKAYNTRIEYHFKDGFIRASCQDWDANTTIPDGLVLTITSMELQKFLKKVYNP